MVLENPATAERSLFLSPNHILAIEGLCDAQGRKLLDALLAYALPNAHELFATPSPTDD